MRCSATVRSTGAQCGKHARKGYTVCGVHGAGYSSRPGGRPIEHGRYSLYGPEFRAKLLRYQRRKLLEELAGLIEGTLLHASPSLCEVLDACADDPEGLTVAYIRLTGKLANTLSSMIGEWIGIKGDGLRVLQANIDPNSPLHAIIDSKEAPCAS